MAHSLTPGLQNWMSKRWKTKESRYSPILFLLYRILGEIQRCWTQKWVTAPSHPRSPPVQQCLYGNHGDRNKWRCRSKPKINSGPQGEREAISLHHHRAADSLRTQSHNHFLKPFWMHLSTEFHLSCLRFQEMTQFWAADPRLTFKDTSKKYNTTPFPPPPVISQSFRQPTGAQGDTDRPDQGE